VFKNVSGKNINLEIELSEPKNLTLRGNLKTTLKLPPGEGDTVQGKIIDQKKPFSFGPMRFGMK
jgi:hypothetical protein